MATRSEKRQGGAVPGPTTPDLVPKQMAEGLPEKLQAGLDRRTSDLVAAARRVRSEADDEAIHDLRVASRRLATALSVWRGLVPPGARRDAARALRRLRRRLGRARELEVHLVLLEKHPAALRPAIAPAVERLERRLEQRRHSAAKRVSPRRLRRVLRTVDDAIAGAAERMAGDPAAPGDALFIERRTADQALAALRGAMARLDEASLHEARLEVKKWRYAIECVVETLPRDPSRASRPLRRLQELLGSARDRTLLCQVLEREAALAGSPREVEGLRMLMARLEAERDRAVRRFQRLATVLVAGPRRAGGATGDGSAPGDAPPPPAVESIGDAVASAPRRDTDAPPDARWQHMATWLEGVGREN